MVCEDVAYGGDVAIGKANCYERSVIPAKVSRERHLILWGLFYGHWLLENLLRLCLFENYL